MKLACFGAVLAITSASTGGKGMRTGSITCADDGTFAVVLDLDTSQVYVEVDHSYMTSVGAGGFPAVRMDLDQECSKHTIYESVFVDSSETGHPPIDPYGGGGWGVPHFDVHFNTKSAATIEGYTCKPGPMNNLQCDQSVGSTIALSPPEEEDVELLAKMNNFPPAEYTTGFHVDYTWGGNAVIGHGHHLVPDGDDSFQIMAEPASGFVVDCEAEGGFLQMGAACGTPSWMACAAGSFGAPDEGCRYGKASLTTIKIVYDGEIVGEELMLTRSHVAAMKDGESDTKPYPQAESAPNEHQGKLRALTSRIDIVGTKARFGFDLAQVGSARIDDASKGGKKAPKGKKGKKGKPKGKAGPLFSKKLQAAKVGTEIGAGIALVGMVSMAALVAAKMRWTSDRGTVDSLLGVAIELVDDHDRKADELTYLLPREGK